MFRRISYPGTLTLNNKYLKFKSENVYGEPITESLFINNIKDIKLKKGLLNNSLLILYNNEWYVFHKFQDKNYFEIYDFLKLHKDE